jgi:ATP-dependent RNA helicase DeaD
MKHLHLVADATDTRTFEEPTPTPEFAEATVFDAVPEPLREALAKRGFSDLTEVQKAVLDSGASGRDLQISSQTGSGKTVALGLALAPRLIEGASARDAKRSLRAMVIVPTRELAVQVSEELRWLFAAVRGVTVECVTGGTSVGMERRRLERGPTVVVGTPGRLNDHIRSRALDCRAVAEVVLDEADRMLDMGFREELVAILETMPEDRATHLVSATFAPMIQKLARKYQNKPLSVEGTRLGDANEDIQHVGHLVRMQDRYATIVNLLLIAKDERTLVFVNTRSGASELADRLATDGFAAAPISGELEQNQRTRTLEAFRTGKTAVLVATDVAARGLDIPEVAMVVHTDAPRDAESYTHRSGRTGRAGRKGRSVLLSAPGRKNSVEYLLKRAKVKLSWKDVPTAAAVEKTLAKRARRELRESLKTAAEPDKKQLTHAQSLLEEMDAETLVAQLVEMCRGKAKAAPQDVSAAPANFHESRGPEKRSTHRDRPVRRERSFDARTARFEINWGRRDGATPERLLAMLCRRGDVTSRVIGTIDIDHRCATFEVTDSAARKFEDSAGRPDSRDPHLVIKRAHTGRR